MGYNTRYSLEITPRIPKKDKLDFITSVAKIFGMEKYVTINDRVDSLFEEEMRWYDHDKDMIKLSKKYPKSLFKLTGVGEEQADIWIKYYQNGKYQVCPAKITFDEFNPKKLIKL